MFQIDSQFLIHDTGSKFYETVLISKGAKTAMLIKRWGGGVSKEGGGQTMIERGSYSDMFKAKDKILREKRAHRSGKGRYLDTSRIRSLLTTNPAATLGPDELRAALGHYNDSEVRMAIDAHFNLGQYEDVDDIVAATGRDVGDIEPEPEPDRGNTWASW